MDIAAIIGTFLGCALILYGMILEGGTIEQLISIPAVFIVAGGTLGAIVMSFTVTDMQQSISGLKIVYFNEIPNMDKLIQEIVGYSQKARKEGVIVLEKEAKGASDPMLTLGLEAVADGADPSLVREMLENQLARLEEKVTNGAKVWEGAGAYAPTIGIIGAVLGLIQVMQNLDNPSKIGAGIAVAFVATIYALIIANLFVIPFSTRIKQKFQRILIGKEIIISGILSIQAGESPALIERKLYTCLLDTKKPAKEGG